MIQTSDQKQGTLLRLHTLGWFGLAITVGEEDRDITDLVYKETGSRGPALKLLKVLLCCSPLLDSHKRSTPSQEWEQHEAPRDVVIEALWPQEMSIGNPIRALSTAKSTLNHALRPYLGEDAVVLTTGTDEIGYALSGQGMVIDADEFEQAVAQASAAEGRGEAALRLWESAYAMVQGEFLPHDQYNDWSVRRRERLHAKYRLCLHRLAALYSTSGRCVEAVEMLHPYVMDHLIDQDTCCLLLPLLAQQGRYEEAVLLYKSVKEALAEENRTPSGPMTNLVRRIRQEQLAAMERVSLSLMTTMQGPEQTVVPVSASFGQSAREISSFLVVSHSQVLLLNEYKELVANEATMCYDSLGREVVEAGARQRLQPEPLSQFQRSVQEKIKDYDLMAQQHARDEKRISRRDALKAIADFPILAYGVMGLGPEKLIYLPCTEEVLPFCAAGLTACQALLAGGDMMTIARVLRSYLPTLEFMARQSSASQQAAAHLASQGYLLAIIIADYQRKLDHMETYCREARVYGQLAGDPNLEVSALLRLANKFDYERRDWKALHTYQEAAALPSFKEVSSLLRGRIYAGLAATNAYVQQKDEAQDFLGLAKETFPEKPEEDPCFHFAYISSYSLVLWEGLTRKHLGQYTQAWNAFSLDGKLQPNRAPLPKLSDRNHAVEFLNYAASVAVKQKQLDVSCLYVESAEETAWNIKHEQRYAEVLETVRNIETLWSHEPAVKRLRDKIRARQA